MAVNTPVLLIVWRRPQTVRRLIDAIRIVAPTRLFVACDGPSFDRPDDADKVAATRDVIEKEIDWPCQLHRLYSDINQGCRQGPISAINWFFNHVDEGIILEDDCIPDATFFNYCEWALSYFRDNKKVMHVNGNNFSAPPTLFGGEVSFASLPQVWGWATWSDRWRLFDGNPFYLQRKVRLENWSLSIIGKFSKLKHLDTLKRGLDAWDYQWQITVLNNAGLVVCPRSNLISNIGVGADATHTNHDHSRTFLRTGIFEEPKKPLVVKNNPRLSSFFEKKMGLSLRPKLLLWLYGQSLSNMYGCLKNLVRFILFSRLTPVVIASTGRSGSTMLTNSIAISLIQARYPFFPSLVKSWLVKLSSSYVDRIQDIDSFRSSPVIKTHDLFTENQKKNLKYIFVYGDPLDSAISALKQGELRGSGWLDQHIFHLCGSGTSDQVLMSDVLNYEAQISSWEKSPAFIVHYSEIWEKKHDLSRYLGFTLLLPRKLNRTTKQSSLSTQANNVLFDKLRVAEHNLRQVRKKS